MQYITKYVMIINKIISTSYLPGTFYYRELHNINIYMPIKYRSYSDPYIKKNMVSTFDKYEHKAKTTIFLSEWNLLVKLVKRVVTKVKAHPKVHHRWIGVAVDNKIST
jgi:hypothetical protein